jgi:hypothetical protein
MSFGTFTHFFYKVNYYEEGNCRKKSFRSLLRLEMIQRYNLEVRIINKNKLEQRKKQNGGQNPDGRKARIIHSSVNFYANQFRI